MASEILTNPCRESVAPIEEVVTGRHRAGHQEDSIVTSSISDRSAHTTAAHDTGAECTPGERVTRSLLGWGMVAGPFYVITSLIHAVLRDGFDLTRHPWSLLANGPTGWVHVANLILTGLMVGAAAVGFRRAMPSGTGHRTVPILLGVFGLGMITSGIFRADPMDGFPLGTPAGPPVSPTLSGVLHLAGGGLGFLAFIVATFVMARRFTEAAQRFRAVGSAATGVAYLAAFVGISTGSTTPVVNLAFTAAVLIGWTWMATTSAYLYRRTGPIPVTVGSDH
jgi:Protein of unknown function (DUF998)